MTRSLALPLTLLAVVACSGAAPSNSPSPSPSPATLDGRTFVSTSVTRDGAPFSLAPGTRIDITFNFGELRASAGCNSMSGTYVIDGNVLRLRGLGMTEMACDPPARMDQEQWFADFISKAPILALDGDQLTMTLGASSIQLVDRREVEPDAQLVGPLWTVETIIEGDAASSVPQGATATISFGADGSVTLNTGCNSGGGRYTVESTTIRFADLATTKRACGGAAGLLEQAVTAVLNAPAVDFTIDAQTLTLGAGGHGLQLRAAATR